MRWAQRVVDGWGQVSRELRIDPAPLPWMVLVAFLRGKENTWSQDEGLALVLLLDKVRPGWQEHVMSAEHASLFELLAP